MFKLSELVVDITGNSGPLNRTLGGMLGQLSGAGRAAGGAYSTAMGLAMAAGLGAALTSSARAAISAEQSLARLAKNADLDPAGVREMKGQLRDLALELKAVPLDALHDIAVEQAKLGVAAENLIPVTRNIAKLSTAFDEIPAGELANQIGMLNATFALGERGALQIGSAVDKLADSSLAAAPDIFNVASRMAGTARQAGLSAEDTLALATALLSTGTRAEQAGGTLNRLLIGLDSAGKLGDDAAGGISGFLIELSKLDTAGRASALSKLGIGGSEDLAEVQKLITQIDNLAEFGAVAGEQFDTLSNIQKSYATSASLAAANVTDFSNRLQILKEDVGAAMLPAVNVGLGLLGDLSAGFGESFTRMTSIVSGWGVDMSGVVEDVGYGFRNLPDFLGIAATMIYEKVLNIIEWFSVIPANLAQVGGYVAGNWRELMTDGVNAVASVFRNLGENIANIAKAIYEFISDPTGGLDFEWTPLLDGFKATAAKLPELIRPELTNLAGEIDRMYEEIGLREMMREKAKGEKKAAEAAAVAAGGGGSGTGGAAGGRSGGGSGGSTDLAGFHRELLEASVKAGGSMPQVQEQKKTNTFLDHMIRRMEQHDRWVRDVIENHPFAAVAVGPA